MGGDACNGSTCFDVTTMQKASFVRTSPGAIMGKILFTTGLLFFYFCGVLRKKVDCGNIGLEEGTANGWILTNGTVENAGSTVAYSNETTSIYANGNLVTKERCFSISISLLPRGGPPTECSYWNKKTETSLCPCHIWRFPW